MRSFHYALAFAALLIVMTAAASQTANAAAADYEFQLLSQQAKVGQPVEIAVRLLHKPEGTPVTNAVIFTARLDMGPESMEEMTVPVEKLSGGEPGIYRFKTKLTMEGNWALSLAAKVPGEAETVKGKLIVKAVP
ncbi:MAG: FixH family protein, partial [Rhodomicrobium sp.]